MLKSANDVLELYLAAFYPSRFFKNKNLKIYIPALEFIVVVGAAFMSPMRANITLGLPLDQGFIQTSISILAGFFIGIGVIAANIFVCGAIISLLVDRGFNRFHRYLLVVGVSLFPVFIASPFLFLVYLLLDFMYVICLFVISVYQWVLLIRGISVISQADTRKAFLVSLIAGVCWGFSYSLIFSILRPLLGAA